MKIVYITATNEEREIFTRYVGSYFRTKDFKVVIDTYTTPEDLMSTFAKELYDIVFLNINYAKLNSVNLVYQLRAVKPDVSIVLLGFSNSGRVRCTIVTPMMFVLEEFTERTCAAMLEQVTSHMSARPDLSLLIRTGNSDYKTIPVTSIVFVEAQDHRVSIKLTSGETVQTRTAINQIADDLSMYSEFLFPHRSFIVNAFHINCITTDSIFMKNSFCASPIPIARGKSKQMRERYLDYYRHYAELRGFMQHFIEDTAEA